MPNKAKCPHAAKCPVSAYECRGSEECPHLAYIADDDPQKLGGMVPWKQEKIKRGEA